MNTLSPADQIVGPPTARTNALLVDADHLEAHRPALEDLAAHSLEPNVFHEPWFLFPAARAFATDRRFRFLLVSDRGHGSDRPRLCGFFPLSRGERLPGSPFPVVSLWSHPYCFLGTPLVRADAANVALDVFFQTLRTLPGSGLVDLPALCADGPVHAAILRYLHERNLAWFEHAAYERPLLRPLGSAEDYLASVLSRRSRRRLRQKETQLRRLGPLEYRTLTPDGGIL